MTIRYNISKTLFTSEDTDYSLRVNFDEQYILHIVDTDIYYIVWNNIRNRTDNILEIIKVELIRHYGYTIKYTSIPVKVKSSVLNSFIRQ